MKLWKLKQYTDILIDEHGWDDTEYWVDIEFDYLKNIIEMKDGHAHIFITKSNKLYQ